MLKGEQEGDQEGEGGLWMKRSGEVEESLIKPSQGVYGWREPERIAEEDKGRVVVAKDFSLTVIVA